MANIDDIQAQIDAKAAAQEKERLEGYKKIAGCTGVSFADVCKVMDYYFEEEYRLPEVSEVERTHICVLDQYSQGYNIDIAYDTDGPYLTYGPCGG